MLLGPAFWTVSAPDEKSLWAHGPFPRSARGPGAVPQLPGCGPLGRALQYGGCLATPSVLASSLPCHTQGCPGLRVLRVWTLTCHSLPGSRCLWVAWPHPGCGDEAVPGFPFLHFLPQRA